MTKSDLLCLEEAIKYYDMEYARWLLKVSPSRFLCIVRHVNRNHDMVKLPERAGFGRNILSAH